MKKTITVGMLLIMSYCLFGQDISDTIEVKKAMGVVFIQNGQKLMPRQLLGITAANPESYKEMKIAKTNYDVGTVFGSAGGFLIGWPIGTAVAGGEPEWLLAAVGAGLIAISIPFSTSYSKHAKKAVVIFNNGLKQSGHNAPEVRLGLTYGGIGVKVTF